MEGHQSQDAPSSLTQRDTDRERDREEKKKVDKEIEKKIKEDKKKVETSVNSWRLIVFPVTGTKKSE